MTIIELGCLLLGLVLGAAAGFGVGWLWARDRSTLSQLAQARIAAAGTQADRQTDARHQAVAELVEPLRASLHSVEAQLRTAERDRLMATAALDEHLASMRATTDHLRSETADLVTALRAPQIRGRWGELQLERAVEAAGMVEHIDYVTQPTRPGPDGALRPDLVVKLVGGKQVVIDSKVAFAGYLEAMEARDDATRTARLRAHARQLRAHVDALSAKEYWSVFTPTPEFVVCFVPADAFLDAALRQDPSLLEHAFEANVVLATPSTLIALLRTVAHTWRQQALTSNTAEVSRLGRELYQRLSTMTGHLDKLGRALTGSVTAFNSTVGAYESRVVVGARRLAELSVVDTGADGELIRIEPVLTMVRSPTPETQLG